ncbi:MAG TPA: hypothetical protein VK213_02450 [Bacteroidales bacterium]|nr:hypothetical protein [Bacteroidales bacterium]
MIRIRIIVIVIILMLPYAIYGQDTSSYLRLMFYNCENAFDIYDDTLHDDDEFLPSGIRRWNKSRYENKIQAIYKTIVAAGGWEPPEIVAFCEIENKHVVEDIISKTYLSKYSYSIIHEESPDQRGIDVCLIFRNDHLRLISYDYWKPQSVDPFDTRTVLYARMAFVSDTFNVIVNHWPSRRGGVLSGLELREQIAEMVKERSDSLQDSGDKYVIITGDFNSNPEDPEMKIFDSDKRYVNLSAQIPAQGTYRYQGRWEMFDQVIVSSALAQGISVNASVLNPGFLLMDDPVYPGKSPFSTYRGFRYQGGFSDHLPVIVTLRLR